MAGCLSQTVGEPSATRPELPELPELPEQPAPPPAQPVGTASGPADSSLPHAPAISETAISKAPAGSPLPSISSNSHGTSADAARQRERRSAESIGQPQAFQPYPVPRPHGLERPPVAAYEDGERYLQLNDNPVQRVAQAPVSTFSIDVDTGSWSNVRRMLNAGRLPPTDAVRVEEMINYFPYDYERPRGDAPFAVHTEIARAPWDARRLLMRVAIKGEDQSVDALPPANLVFLVDVSGSMNSADKLPLLKSSLKLLADRMRPQDRLSLVTYASGTSVVLEAAPGSDKARIAAAIDGLRAGGSTAGASGIELAYRVARQAFVANGINRILLATDGDFNVGITDFKQLKDLVAARRATGIALSTLGFGTGNFNERLMEQLADVGDGSYAYIDTLMEGHKVLVDQMSSTLATIARDVKIQVEFNPARIAEYRLIGYENRLLAREDFNNDKVDAGDIGAGHTVTALYELTPVGEPGSIDALRYGDPAQRDGRRVAAAGVSGELAFVRLRYKRPQDTTSRLIEQAVTSGDPGDVGRGSAEFRFATAVAGFGQMLRGGRHTGTWRIADARALAAQSIGSDRFGYRAEAVRLMDLAGALSSNRN